jgi:hypothetical protein
MQDFVTKECNSLSVELKIFIGRTATIFSKRTSALGGKKNSRM